MTKEQILENIRLKQSFLCVGLDPDMAKMPPSLRGDLFAFNREIIDATAPHAIAFKPNLAFYEVQGARGYAAFEQTVAYIRDHYPDIFIIADAKRGDIGNTSRMYASSVFDTLGVDAITVAPYMGEDSVSPFLGYDGKWVILLALTSNMGSRDFQLVADAEGTPLWERVLTTSQQWADSSRMMYVVGATKAEMLSRVRELVPYHFLLVPGVGAQGGSLDEVARHGITRECGLIVNSSRGIIHASSGEDFARKAAQKASELQAQMAQLLAYYEIL
ncbi:MAG: orotidine-5'-phosphate decarboxylase [Muribaculaceae bacterium]|nr:orotidine-5'-phosphate decarboxylase [Muribaculaceae bacterium]